MYSSTTTSLAEFFFFKSVNKIYRNTCLYTRHVYTDRHYCAYCWFNDLTVNLKRNKSEWEDDDEMPAYILLLLLLVEKVIFWQVNLTNGSLEQKSSKRQHQWIYCTDLTWQMSKIDNRSSYSSTKHLKVSYIHTYSHIIYV